MRNSSIGSTDPHLLEVTGTLERHTLPSNSPESSAKKKLSYHRVIYSFHKRLTNVRTYIPIHIHAQYHVGSPLTFASAI